MARNAVKFARLVWANIPTGPASMPYRILLRTPKETAHERWRREINAWHPRAMDTRGRRTIVRRTLWPHP